MVRTAPGGEIRLDAARPRRVHRRHFCSAFCCADVAAEVAVAVAVAVALAVALAVVLAVALAVVLAVALAVVAYATSPPRYAACSRGSCASSAAAPCSAISPRSSTYAFCAV